MRYTIEGFSQIEAIKFRRTEIVNGREKVVTLDCTDLVILRWFVDFWPNMMKVEISGRQYAWVSYKALIEDMPLIGIKKGMLALRLKKMVDFGILTHQTIKSGGTFSYYGFGPDYTRLIDTDHAQQNSDPTQDISEGVLNKLDTPAQKISDQIDSSTKDSSTKELKERKKPSSFDAIIAERTDNEKLRDVIGEFIRMRSRIKKPLTNYALQLRLNKLWRLGKTDDERIAIVEQSVGACWQDFFPLKDDSPMTDRRAQYTEEQNKEFDLYSFSPDQVIQL